MGVAGRTEVTERYHDKDIGPGCGCTGNGGSLHGGRLELGDTISILRCSIAGISSATVVIVGEGAM